VDDANLPICQASQLYGAPNSTRAAKQILTIRHGELALFYTVHAKEIHGVYRVETEPFIDAHPESGPWNRRRIDELHGFYPYRIELETVEAYSRPLKMDELRSKRLGLAKDVIRRGSSVVYLDETDTQKLLGLLERANRNSLRLDLVAPQARGPKRPESDYVRGLLKSERS
jgi:hypothetical protein